MAEIKDCIGKNVKISKNSITIKNEEGKTCGVVRNIISLYDMQANKQFEYYKWIKSAGLHGKISIKDCIISDGIMYIFRDIKSKLYYKKYGYFSEDEKKRIEEIDMFYSDIEENGLKVIECVYL